MLLRVRKGSLNTACQTSMGGCRIAMAGVVLGAWHLYAKLACSLRFISAASSSIYSFLLIEWGLTVFFRPTPAIHQNCQTTIGKSKAAIRFRRKQTFVFDTRISGPVTQRKKSTFQTGGRPCSVRSKSQVPSTKKFNFTIVSEASQPPIKDFGKCPL
jgi:hypothetical protein